MKTIFLVFLHLIMFAFTRGQNAQNIHQKALLVDTHNDFISSSIEEHLNFNEDLKGRAHSDLQRMFQGGVDVQIFSVYCDDTYGKGSAFSFANQEIDSLYVIVSRSAGKMEIVTTPNEILKAVKEKKLAAMLGVEGGHMIEDDISNLDSLYKRGVRYMTLTWNNSTSWATSAKDESNHAFIASPYGLTDFGKKIVKRMNDLGMIVDISHVGEKTFWDVLSVADKPVIASHSSAYSICPVFRNLKDDQIKAIAKNKGVIQINFYSGFIDSTYELKQKKFFNAHKKERDSLVAAEHTSFFILQYLTKKYPEESKSLRPPLSLLIDHIDYIVKLVGPDYVGLGSDFDGTESTPLELDGVQDFPHITQALLERGYSKKNIEKILGGNFMRVFKANTR
ncbi:MAG: dipeptidase [Bacteroidetes bacterium]|nr:dipeptidase [Bacteroidota bacterium]